MKETVHTENRMGTESMGMLLLKMSAPMCLSMLVQAFYNVVDSIFVSRIDEYAMTAISLAFPIQTLMVSFCSGTAVGINSLLSRSLGEKNGKKVKKTACNGIFVEILTALAFCLFGIFASRFYFASQTATPQVIEYGHSYLSIVTIGSICFMMEMTLERLLQSTGRTFYTMITQTTGAVTNIIFDPIMIFGLFGFPKLGMAGAAIATVFGQFVAMVLALIFNIRKNPDISLDFRGFRPCPSIIREIYAVGLPSIVMQAIGSLTTYLLNLILIAFSETAVTALGVYFKLQGFFFMPVFGLNNALVPVIAYNYGARRKKRITDAVRYGIIGCMSIMIAGVLLFNLLPGVLLSFFNAGEELLRVGIPALRIISFSFLGAGFCIVLGSSYQALGNGIYSLIVSLMRQVVILIPAAFILSRIFDVNGVWFSYPLAECMSVAVNLVLYRKIYNRKIRVLPDSSPAE